MTAKISFLSNGTEAHEEYGLACSLNMAVAQFGLMDSELSPTPRHQDYLFGNQGKFNFCSMSTQIFVCKQKTEKFAKTQFIFAIKILQQAFIRRLLTQEATYADNSRHYGFYIDGDIAKLPGGGRKGAAVLCELLPDQLAQDPSQQQQQPQPQQGQQFGQQGQPYGQQRGQQRQPNSGETNI